MDNEQRARPATDGDSSTSDSPWQTLGRGVLLAAAAIVLFGSFIWVTNLERTLPEIRTPRDPESSELLSGHALMTPGDHSIATVDHATSGEWVEQEIGESEWLASQQSGSTMYVAFYGTDISVLARTGPEAGRAYVHVNDREVDHLLIDDGGSYVNLWAGQAVDQPIPLASGLAHGEHIVELTVAGDGEVAISGFEVEAATPFTWAFVMMYAGLAGGMFLILRTGLRALSSRHGTNVDTRQRGRRVTETE